MENIKKEIGFLVTAIGSMSAGAVIKSLRINFPNSFIVGTDIHQKEWLYLSEKVDVFYKVPKAADKDFVSSINNILNEQAIDFILPLTDPEVDVLSENRAQLKNQHTILTLPDDSVISICRNKEKFVQLLKEISEVRLIETITKEKIKNINFSLPLIGKPKKGRSSEGLRYIQSINELSVLGDDYILQPFIKGDIITVDVVRDQLGNFACLSRRELIRSANGAGLSVEIFSNKKIEKLVGHITKALNITGCMNIEFIKHGEQYYLMDINPRFSAGVGFSILAGYDFILNHVMVYQNRKILPIYDTKNIVAVKHYKDHILA